jgi:hypothetical protein
MSDAEGARMADHLWDVAERTGPGAAFRKLAYCCSRPQVAHLGATFASVNLWEASAREQHETVNRLAADLAAERARAAHLLEAGNALAKAADRVVRGAGTTQRYEYLADALDAWECALVPRAGGDGEGVR